ncbi:carbon-nitrogen family hydrolase [Paenibacillus bovis]|uniref:Nitrilase n=1 Tax=Paenibacillus bovis TaxID=1616788 RepID=A0A172ZII2_9BACL|nr:carbon-nitrogen family hydrolase [Paenibacillus bovis]ANF97398.1 nitrilase [Paenibacillus bovis]
MTTRALHISLIQMDIELGNPEVNLQRAEEWITRAMEAQPRPDVIVLPEMWNTGYALDRLDGLAEPENGPYTFWMSETARHYKITLVGGSISEQRQSGFYNTLYVFGPDGERTARYDKIHLFKLMNEEKFMQPGEETALFPLGDITAAASICYDIRFPELARTLALAGAKVWFVPAEWPHPRLNHWRTLLTARAIENQMYVIACNRVGRDEKSHFFGHSMVIDPWGEIVAESNDEEGILTATIDLDLSEEVRGRIPVFTDRRPELYRHEEK